MSLALRANDADFSKGLGRHAEPFVAAADLITGWDFKDFSKWKVGVVPGQVATALRNDGTASDEPFSRSLDGLGLAMTEEGRISYGVSIAPFTNVVSVRPDCSAGSSA